MDYHNIPSNDNRQGAQLKKMPDFHLEVANPDHIQGIQELLYPKYFEESCYCALTDYSEENTLNMINEWLENFAFVAIADGKVVGFAAMGLMRTFYKHNEAEVDMYYVLREYRGTRVSRALTNAIVENAKANEVKIIYASCSSGIDEKNNNLYCNLWKKQGFKKLGTVMIWSK